MASADTLNIPYYPDNQPGLTPYQQERCRLDVFAPEQTTDCPVLVWFHGGGLAWGGKDDIPAGVKGPDLIVVSVNYRLFPQISCPAYLEDAAAAVAWTFQHIEEFGGSAKKIFVAGHSAGGYLASMVGLDKRWLAAFGVDANRIAGLIPMSGQCITHLTIRKERGIDIKQPVVDEFAPLFHVRGDAPPILLLSGDREMEMVGRYEENAYLMRMLKINGHPNVTLCEFQGYGHGMTLPGTPLMLNFIKAISAKIP
jgi:acetyl esterase/lipase